jgi:glycerophosphoryl diester phosphodiesterase
MKDILTVALVCSAAAVFAAQPKCIAHRGESVDAPENTMPSYRLAMERDTDGFECDIYLTKDGEIVCSHDGDMKRLVKDPRTIKGTDVAELRKLDFGAWKGPQFKGTQIPLFTEMIALAKDGREIYVEIKCGPEILPKLKEELARVPAATPERVVFISFNAKAIAAVRAQLPAYRAYLLLGFKKDKKTGELVPGAEAMIQKAKACNASGLDVEQSIPDASVRALQAAKIPVHIWTVDKADRARHFAALGVASITSNRAAAIKRELSQP